MSPFVFDLVLKLTVTMVVGLAVAAALRGSAPSLRHLVLFATIASGLALPIVMLLSPRFDLPLLPPDATAAALSSSAPAVMTTATISPAVQSVETSELSASSIQTPQQ